jgi:hypothetical protein
MKIERNSFNKNQRKILKLPMKLFFWYILTTLFMFLFGPIKYYYVDNQLFLLSFICFFLIVASAFYYLGAHCVIQQSRMRIPLTRKKILRFALIYSFALCILIAIQDAAVHGFQIGELLIKDFFSRMAETYTDVDFFSTPASWISSYTNWLKIIALTGGVFYYQDLSKIERWCFYGVIALTCFDVIFFVGSQKQLFDLVIYLYVPFFSKRLIRGKKRKMILVTLIVAFILIIFTGNVIESRRELWAYRYNSSVSYVGATIDTNNWLYGVLPSSISTPITIVSSYTSQGYRGLALCLKLPFEWAYGMGSSFKMMRDFSRWFNIPLSSIEVSYPVRMQAEFGIGAYAQWHTIFPWLASDYTWIGAVLIVSLLIYYWGKSWRELLILNNLPALLMFAHLCVMVVYIPCNNQLFQTRSSIVSTFVVFVIWFLFHGRDLKDINTGGEEFK